MSHIDKVHQYHCRFTKATRQKLKIISQKTGLSQADLLDKLIAQEYNRLKETSWDGLYVQLNIFNDQPVDDPISLFDIIEDKVTESA